MAAAVAGEESEGSALVAKLYLGLLGRLPEAGGAEWAVAALRQGESAGQVAAAIAGAPEAAARSAGLGDMAFLMEAHRGIFQHAPDAESLFRWMDRLAEGESRPAIAAEMATMPATRAPEAAHIDLAGNWAPAAESGPLDTLSLGHIALPPVQGLVLAVEGLWDAAPVAGPVGLGPGAGAAPMISLHIQGADGHGAADWTDTVAMATPDQTMPALEAMLGLLPGTLDGIHITGQTMEQLLQQDAGHAVSFDWAHDPAEQVAPVPHDHIFFAPASPAAAPPMILTIPPETDWASGSYSATITLDHGVVTHDHPGDHDLHHVDPSLIG